MRKKYYLVKVAISPEMNMKVRIVHTFLINCTPDKFLDELKSKFEKLHPEWERTYYNIINIYIL